jgi:hypothetical protein
MKIVSIIIKYAFTLIGAGMLVSVFSTYRDTSAFVTAAIKTEGTVIGSAQSRSSRKITYNPVVQFTDQNGQTIRSIAVADMAKSRSSDYVSGEPIEILYLPTDPHNARVNSFLSLWAGPIFMGSIASIFFLIGSSMVLVGILQSRKEKFLRKNGTPIDTEYQSVELNTSLSINGQCPFIVLTQWQDPSTSKLRHFKSNNLWFDPSDYIQKGTKITVFIAQGNPDKYYVDLSFLPER